MKAKWVNPFISNAISVFEQLGSIKFEKTDISIKEDTTPTNEISIIIGITGYIQGQVVYSLKEHTANRIANEVKPNESIKVDNSFIEFSGSTYDIEVFQYDFVL